MALDVPRPTGRPLTIVVLAIALATVVGLVVLWPDTEAVDAQGVQPQIDARVVELEQDTGTQPSNLGEARSYDVAMVLLEGPHEGRIVTTEALLDGLPPLEVGQRVRVVGNATDGWFIADFDRARGLWILAAVFGLVVVMAGGWQGVRSLAGLVVSLMLIVTFVVPAILAGSSPAAVALVGAVAVMLATLYLSHGTTTKTSVAVVGTSLALVVTVGLGLWFIDAAVITGYSSEDAVMASFQVSGLDVSGLVLAGLIIAALGVLDDVSVAQASTVYALHDTDSDLQVRTLFRRAMVVGRDHIAATVNTLFLAYAGASLALLILFTTSGRPWGDIITSEIVAVEMVKTMVGSLGLIVAVPITTMLAAVMAVRRSDAEIRVSRAGRVRDGGHGH